MQESKIVATKRLQDEGPTTGIQLTAFMTNVATKMEEQTATIQLKLRSKLLVYP